MVYSDNDIFPTNGFPHVRLPRVPNGAGCFVCGIQTAEGEWAEEVFIE